MKVKELFDGRNGSRRSKRLVLRTPEPIAFCDITDLVAQIVIASGVTNGAVVVSTRHTTTALTCTEGDPALHRDIIDMLERLIPRDGVDYRHAYEGVNNARAHLSSVLLGTSTLTAVRRGQLDLGTWQHLYLVELWSSMERSIDIVVVPLTEERKDA